MRNIISFLDKFIEEKQCGYDTATVIVLYKLGLLIIIPALIAVILLHTKIADSILLRGGLQCALKKATGIPCPGCGGTRAAFALAGFRIIDSIKLNASVFFGALFYCIFILTETLHFKTGVRGFSEKGFFIMFYTWLAIVIIQWVLKITAL